MAESLPPTYVSIEISSNLIVTSGSNKNYAVCASDPLKKRLACAKLVLASSLRCFNKSLYRDRSELAEAISKFRHVWINQSLRSLSIPSFNDLYHLPSIRSSIALQMMLTKRELGRLD